MSSPRVQVAAVLASARLVGCKHHEATCARCLADAVLPVLAAAWESGWLACESANCDNCYSCGAWVGNATNPFRETA